LGDQAVIVGGYDGGSGDAAGIIWTAHLGQ
jgi:hypothetical protein